MKTDSMTSIKYFMLIASIFCILSISAHEQEGAYVEEGEEYYWDGEIIVGDFYDGIYYWVESFENPSVRVVSKMNYIMYDGDITYYKTGGYYKGELTVPSEMYGYEGMDQYFKVTAIMGMYKNGLTALYLPETIERIYWTIESCRYLETVHLNNSLRELEGVKDCPVLTDCPLPLSLERIGDGWMSGIAISETVFPQGLAKIGKGVFCNNPNLKKAALGRLAEMGDSCFSLLPALEEITLPASLEKMGEGCFTGCLSLRRLAVEDGATISDRCFINCPSIKEVYLYSAQPMDFPQDFMKDTDLKSCTLYVPEGSVELYRKTEGWREFRAILPIIETGLDSAISETGEWRAFPSRGMLVIDSTTDDVINVFTLAGRLAASAGYKGRTELTLPKGAYIVSSSGKTAKVNI